MELRFDAEIVCHLHTSWRARRKAGARRWLSRRFTDRPGSASPANAHYRVSRLSEPSAENGTSGGACCYPIGVPRCYPSRAHGEVVHEDEFARFWHVADCCDSQEGAYGGEDCEKAPGPRPCGGSNADCLHGLAPFASSQTLLGERSVGQRSSLTFLCPVTTLRAFRLPINGFRTCNSRIHSSLTPTSPYVHSSSPKAARAPRPVAPRPRPDLILH